MSKILNWLEANRRPSEPAPPPGVPLDGLPPRASDWMMNRHGFKVATDAASAREAALNANSQTSHCGRIFSATAPPCECARCRETYRAQGELLTVGLKSIQLPDAECLDCHQWLPAGSQHDCGGSALVELPHDKAIRENQLRLLREQLDKLGITPDRKDDDQ